MAEKCTTIGGQAVIEGVMMRGKKSRRRNRHRKETCDEHEQRAVQTAYLQRYGGFCGLSGEWHKNPDAFCGNRRRRLGG